VDNFERVEVLKPSGDLQQLVESIRESTAHGAEMNLTSLGLEALGLDSRYCVMFPQWPQS
jgi:hypothetical protein